MRQRRFAAILAAAMCCCALGSGRQSRSLDPQVIVQAFADDNMRFNATRMMWNFYVARNRNDGGVLASAIPALEEALFSPDWQQRQFCAAALRCLPYYNPSERMLDVTVEGLRNDELPRGLRLADGARTWSPVSNATAGTTYLLGHADLASDFLLDGLESDDDQQRFLCAYILGMSGHTRALPLAAEILIEHLQDNDIDGDAVWATAALYRFGPRVIPILERVRPADEQQRRAVSLILLDLLDPPDSRESLEGRRKILNLSTMYYDPAIEYEHGRVALRSW
jgi:hypothetical protein